MPRSRSSESRPERVAPTAARRILGWTNNLLATGLILVVALTFGVQTMRWWYAGDQPQGSSQDSLDSLSANPLRLDLGRQAGRWRRVEVLGNRHELLAQMVDETRLEIQDQAVEFAIAATPRLTALAKQLETQEPQWKDDLGHRIYVQDGPLPMAIACRAALPMSDDSERPAAVSLSVGCWTIALPGGQLSADSVLDSDSNVRESLQAWTLVVCHPHQSTSGDDPNAWGMPPGVDMRFSMSDEAKQSLVSFGSRDRVDFLQQEIDKRWRQLGWTQIQWSSDSRHTWGSCLSEKYGRVRVDLVATPVGCEGLMTRTPP